MIGRAVYATVMMSIYRSSSDVPEGSANLFGRNSLITEILYKIFGMAVNRVGSCALEKLRDIRVVAKRQDTQVADAFGK